MKPSHLAALAIAGLGVGGMLAAPIPATGIEIQQSNLKSAIKQSGHSAREIKLAMMRGGPAKGEAPPMSWMKKNQRQIRKARRRSFAAGNRNAFQ